jgi:hypothetical protein
MRIKKLENILNSGSFYSDISPEVALALKAKLNKSSSATTKEDTPNKPLLDFEEINQEAIKFAATEVKYPKNLPKGVIISVRKNSSSSTVR